MTLTLDQLITAWPTLTKEQRIEEGVALAMAIVRPEEWTGYVFDQSLPHKWQHVEACRARITGALHQVAGQIDLDNLPPAGGGAKEHRARTLRKQWAAHLFGDIMCDYGSCGLPTTKSMANGGALSELCTIAFAVATGRIGKHPNQELYGARRCFKYVTEVWGHQKIGGEGHEGTGDR